MDTRWLQDFLTLAETSNFTKAAARRNTSQAAFSRRIQSLEAWAGAALIDRSTFPTALTAAGEQFRQHAADLLTRLMDARGDLEGRPVFGRDHVRIALPYVISTAGFPIWWSHWTEKRPLSCTMLHGNIHDLSAALVSGAADIMICHEDAEQPVHFDEASFERVVLDKDVIRPWASRAWLAERTTSFPGSESKPLPLLMYPSGVYFARVVALALENAPQKLHGIRFAESDMADVLHGLAVSGHGVAWLPESTVKARGSELLPLGGSDWERPLRIVAHRARATKTKPVNDLWRAMQAA